MDVIAKIVLKKEYEEKFRAGIAALIGPTLKESGCLRFEVFKDEKDDCVYWLVERWRKEADLMAHYEQSYVRTLIDHYDEWLAEPLSVVRLTPFVG